MEIGVRCPIFLSTLSLRRATLFAVHVRAVHGISIHALLAESDAVPQQENGQAATISIHALLAESDVPRRDISAYHRDFYPRSPCGERLTYQRQINQKSNFYPRSPCGERLWPGLLARPFFIISIHALLAESDFTSVVSSTGTMDFYPRSPCGERPRRCRAASSAAYFYPRSPCGERLGCLKLLVTLIPISIHALLAESDCECWMVLNHLLRFLSTLSLRRATVYNKEFRAEHPISIHALLAESDFPAPKYRRILLPRFLSTLSLRRATYGT